jgi:hypothetical protein
MRLSAYPTRQRLNNELAVVVAHFSFQNARICYDVIFCLLYDSGRVFNDGSISELDQDQGLTGQLVKRVDNQDG